MSKLKPVGRLLRSSPVTARALTEYRVAHLRHDPAHADLWHCLKNAMPGSTAIDVGASVGNYALALSKAVGPKGRVFAIEPNPNVFRELVNSTWRSNVQLLNVAASSHSGWAQLSVPKRGAETQEQLATLEERQDGEKDVFRVPTITIDGLVLESSLPVSVIKIDVEGHELEVIAGAAETVKRDRPVLLVEIESRHLKTVDVEDVVAAVVGMGYTCAGIQGRRLIPWEDFSVREHQVRCLDENMNIRDDQRDRYVNNFLFTPLNRRAGSR